MDEDCGGFRRSRYRGVERTRLYGELVATAYNLVKMSRLIAERSPKSLSSHSLPG